MRCRCCARSRTPTRSAGWPPPGPRPTPRSATFWRYASPAAPNGANPHHGAGERTIQTGDPVVLDFGGLRDGYGSDTTRTVHVGPPSAEVSRVYDIVRQAQ